MSEISTSLLWVLVTYPVGSSPFMLFDRVYTSKSSALEAIEELKSYSGGVIHHNVLEHLVMTLDDWLYEVNSLGKGVY